LDQDPPTKTRRDKKACPKNNNMHMIDIPEIIF